MATISIFFYLIFISFSQATISRGDSGNGFTTTLFHRDSPFSPLGNSSLSRYDRLNNAFRRSFSRAATLFRRATAATTAAAIQSPISPDSGEYLMSVSIGTPPVAYVAIADTGSDLTWTQCLPCLQCFDQSHPIFNPFKSFSFRRLPCMSRSCHALHGGCGPHGACNYRYTYGDQTYTKGDLGFDKITLGSSVVHTVIGCGHESGGGFGESSGLIGLGGGELSLISQMRQNDGVSRRFSYCLPPVLSEASGKINFGQNAIVSGPQVVSTPLVPKRPDTFYYITLEAVSIGNERHEADMSSVRGNMMIDSGTTLTILPKELYDGVVSSLMKVVRARRMNDPHGFSRLCYAVDNNDEVDIPVITAHFTGGADLKLLPVNTFRKVVDDVGCLTLAPTSTLHAFGILGNLAQANFLIGYDLEMGKLSFKPTVCA